MQGLRAEVNGASHVVIAAPVVAKIGAFNGKRIADLRERLGPVGNRVLGEVALSGAGDSDATHKTVLQKVDLPSAKNVIAVRGIADVVASVGDGQPLPALPTADASPDSDAVGRLKAFDAVPPEQDGRREVQCDGATVRIDFDKIGAFFGGTTAVVPGPRASRSASTGKPGHPFTPPDGFAIASEVLVADFLGHEALLYFHTEEQRADFKAAWWSAARVVMVKLGNPPSEAYQERFPSALVHSAVALDGIKLADALERTLVALGFGANEVCLLVRGHGMEMQLPFFIEHIGQYTTKYNADGTGATVDFTFVIPTTGVVTLVSVTPPASGSADDAPTAKTYGLGGTDAGTVQVSGWKLMSCPAMITIYDEMAHEQALEKRTRDGKPAPGFSFPPHMVYHLQRWLEKARRALDRSRRDPKSSVRFEVTLFNYDLSRGSAPTGQTFASQLAGGNLPGITLSTVSRELWMQDWGVLVDAMTLPDGTMRNAANTRGENSIQATPNPVAALVTNAVIGMNLTSALVTGASQVRAEREPLTAKEIARQKKESASTIRSIAAALSGLGDDRDADDVRTEFEIFAIRQIVLVPQGRGTRKSFKPVTHERSTRFSLLADRNRGAVASKVVAGIIQNFADTNDERAGTLEELKAAFTRVYIRQDNVLPPAEPNTSDDEREAEDGQSGSDHVPEKPAETRTDRNGSHLFFFLGGFFTVSPLACAPQLLDGVRPRLI